MLEITTTRHNPLVDPHLAVWSWEIPVYLFLGGIVAGLMILGGITMLRNGAGRRHPTLLLDARADCSTSRCMNIGMGALFLDLAHKLYVWRVYVDVPDHLADVVGLVGAHYRLLPAACLRPRPRCPKRGHGSRAPSRLSGAGRAWRRARRTRSACWVAANIVLGIALGIYTGDSAQHHGRAAALEQRVCSVRFSCSRACPRVRPCST